MPTASFPSESDFDRRAYPAALAFSDWLAPDGWRHRAYRWPIRPDVAPRGSMLFQSGRADFIEKYLEACDRWHRAGWAVEGFDWRGQGGSGRIDPDNPADDRASFDPLTDDLGAYVAAWRARTPPPHVVVAHSMGAHIALRLLAERGVRLDAVVLVAPMLALNTGGLPLPIAKLVIRGMLLAGRGGRAAWHDRFDDPRRQSRLTEDRARYEDSRWWTRKVPGLAGGSPSWRWLAAAIAGADRIERDPLESVETCVLILVAGRDPLVDEAAIRRAASRLPCAELRRFPTAAHELLREADRNRLAALAAIDDFLARRAPAS